MTDAAIGIQPPVSRQYERVNSQSLCTVTISDAVIYEERLLGRAIECLQRRLIHARVRLCRAKLC